MCAAGFFMYNKRNCRRGDRQMENTEKRSDRQKRIDHFEKQRRALLEAGYTEHIRTVSVTRANIMALITAGPFAAAAVLLYWFRWQGGSLNIGLKGLGLLLLCFLVSIPVHEGIHGLTWGLFCEKGFKSIRFGFMKEYLTPYCHCTEALSFGRYIAGGLAPFFILGIGAFLAAFFAQSPVLLFFSAISILSAGGDTTVALLLLPYRDAKILDHPTDCGFAAFRKAPAAEGEKENKPE